MEADPRLSLLFAIPDHPWVDSADGAAVRIAMTVATAGKADGILSTVIREETTGDGAAFIELQSKAGLLNSNLTVGVDVGKAVALKANVGVSSRGHELGSSGFILTQEEAVKLGYGSSTDLQKIIRPYLNGRDLTNKPRGVLVIDPHGWNKDELLSKFPTVYQWLHDRVLPDRSQNRDKRLRKYWWLHRRSREDWRTMSKQLPRFIATVETAKHRVFQFLDASILPDNRLVCFALEDAYSLGVLSSKIHVGWTLATGGVLEDRPVYNKTICFETFPFPDANTEQKESIAAIAERLDAHRKRQLEAHPHLTLTGIYNVLEKVRHEEELTAKDRKVYEDGLIGVLRELHDGLDAAVAEAYGWPSDIEAEEVLSRLLDLNQQRAAEELKGKVRWLRPEYQAPEGAGDSQEEMEGLEAKAAPVAPAPKDKIPWPKELAQQAALVRQVAQETAWSTEAPIKALSGRFKGVRAPTVQSVVDALITLGQLR
jgi:hypothetical protein